MHKQCGVTDHIKHEFIIDPDFLSKHTPLVDIYTNI